jgi:hypothetical protein
MIYCHASACVVRKYEISKTAPAKKAVGCHITVTSNIQAIGSMHVRPCALLHALTEALNEYYNITR